MIGFVGLHTDGVQYPVYRRGQTFCRRNEIVPVRDAYLTIRLCNIIINYYQLVYKKLLRLVVWRYRYCCI